MSKSIRGLRRLVLVSNQSARAAGRLALVFVVLGLLNLLTFRGHYFDDFGFPWDFMQAYYGMGAFSVSALTAGELPEWMPYQCMGYPFLLNPQAAFYYPPMWLFAAIGVDYTVHAAVVLQCLHVLFGALGAYFFLLRQAGSQRFALVGAVAYHFFGGFYSNSQHVDIVRSFALIPWLFHGLTLNPKGPPLLGKGSLLLPLWVYLLATGGYAGNLIAASLAAALFVGLQLVQRGRRKLGRTEALRSGAVVGALVAAGFAMAAVHLGPIWLNSAAFHRTAAVGALQYSDLWSVGFGSLVLSSQALSSTVNIAMTSTFVTVPFFVLMFFVPGRMLRTQWPLVSLLLYAALMSGGPRSPLWLLVSTWLPPVRLSRFPTSDYRPLVALGLIALGVLALSSLVRGEKDLRKLSARSAAALGALALIAYRAYGTLTHPQVVWSLLVGAASVVVLSWLPRTAKKPRWIAALALTALVIADALRVLPDMETWRQPEASRLYAAKGWSHESPRDLARADGVEAVVSTRPAREVVGHPNWFSWAGYLQHRYMMADRTPCLLEVAHEAQRTKDRAAFMLDPWTPLLVDPEKVERTETGFDLPSGSFGGAGSPSSDASVGQVRYGLDEVSYAVRLVEPALLIENEIYFPGWTAVLETPGGEERIEATAADEVFRAWSLPAGDYRMVARFRTPGLRGSAVLSLGGLMLWSAACFLVRRSSLFDSRRHERA